MSMGELVERCSAYSGWKLQWRLQDPGTTDVRILIWDPRDPKSRCVFGLSRHPGSSRVREVYGRLRHWGITPEEQRVMTRVMRDTLPPVTEEPVDQFANPFGW